MDATARTRVRIRGRRFEAFHVCGLVGLTLAIGVGTALTLHRGLALWVFGAVVLTAVATFLALAMVTKIIVGEERLVYYHHEVAILLMSALMLGLMGQPVLAYLDATILGVGSFLVCGRIGCFMVGCCHGRPHRLGVCYRPEHADAGFTTCFVRVRLFPIQLVESAWVFATVAVGVALVLRGAAPGEALAWYVIVYDLGRFSFEFLRGDARPYRGGFSEAQWTSVLLMLVVVAAELGGAIPLRWWHVAATGSLVLAMAGVTLHRRRDAGARRRLRSARHIREVAEAVEQLAEWWGEPMAPAAHRRAVHVVCTSAGLLISGGRTEGVAGEVEHYAMSAADTPLSEADARAVAGLLLHLRHRGGPGEVVRGRDGVYHLLVRTAGAPGTTPRQPAEASGVTREAALR